MDAFVMLQELLEQEQFELIFPERSISGQPDIRLVYLMNDAVESFLVFHNARMTGEYRPDYEGEISASMSFEDKEYILVVHQGDSVVTIFFEDLLTDVHLYNYGEIGHFWMKDYEYLRQLEYRLAIMRDKYDYLGEEYCTPEERKLAMLVDFPSLNYCCYPAVPEQYIVPRVEPWVPTEEAIAVMEKLAAEADDKGLLKILKNYRKHPKPYIAKKIAAMLHRKGTAPGGHLLHCRAQNIVLAARIGDILRRGAVRRCEMRKDTHGHKPRQRTGLGHLRHGTLHIVVRRKADAAHAGVGLQVDLHPAACGDHGCHAPWAVQSGGVGRAEQKCAHAPPCKASPRVAFSPCGWPFHSFTLPMPCIQGGLIRPIVRETARIFRREMKGPCSLWKNLT